MPRFPAAALLAVLVLAACAPHEGEAADALRAATPPAAGSAPAATGLSDPLLLPAEFGSFDATLGPLRLLHEGTPAQGEATAWVGEGRPVLACPEPLPMHSLAGLQASRNISMNAPESSEREGVLVFRDRAAAQAFMAELHAAATQCSAPLAKDDIVTTRDRHSVAAYDGLGDEAFSTGRYTEKRLDDAWTAQPGAEVTLWVRRDRVVAR